MDHAGYFLVIFHQAGEKVARTGVVVDILNALHVFVQLNNNLLVVGEQVLQHLSSPWYCYNVFR